jgi:hypothetical protein
MACSRVCETGPRASVALGLPKQLSFLCGCLAMNFLTGHFVCRPTPYIRYERFVQQLEDGVFSFGSVSTQTLGQ